MDLSQLPLDIQLIILEKYQKNTKEMCENRYRLNIDIQRRCNNFWDKVEYEMWNDYEGVEEIDIEVEDYYYYERYDYYGMAIAHFIEGIVDG